CTLRPTSRRIGERHCALILENNKLFVEDLHGALDTFVDDVPIQGKVELRNGQRLRVGPLSFEVQLPQDASETLPIPSADDEAAALLLEGRAPTDEDSWSKAPQRISPRDPLEDPTDSPTSRAAPKQPTAEETTEAARQLLKKYGKVEGLRNPRRKN